MKKYTSHSLLSIVRRSRNVPSGTEASEPLKHQTNIDFKDQCWNVSFSKIKTNKVQPPIGRPFLVNEIDWPWQSTHT